MLKLVVFVLCLLGASALDNGLARTPPMGWSSWNHFHRNINAELFVETAQAMATNGMKDVGYQYINIDGGWWAGSDTGHAIRNSTGYMQINLQKFPNGLKPMIDKIHALGLKWGMYTDAGKHFCNKDYPASEGYEVQDSKLFAYIGSDMLKIDACGVVENPYVIMKRWRDLIAATKRPILISNCHNGCQTHDSNVTWCPSIANMWRSSADIQDNWEHIMNNLDTLVGRSYQATPGAWNDPDFLEVGNSGISVVESQSQFALWAITSSPLIAGNDLRNMSKDILDILTNKEVIEVNQLCYQKNPAAGCAGDRIWKDAADDLEVWGKLLSVDGRYAAVLFNRGATTKTISVTWKQLGLQEGGHKVRDIIAHKDLGSFKDGFSAPVESHAVKMILITGETPEAS